MKIQDVPFRITEWGKLEPVEYKGERGTSFWRTFEEGHIRVRMVEYSPGFKSDHWCSRGHILLVLEGELVIQLRDGKEFRLSSGVSFQVGDDESNPHLAVTEKGAKVFIVD
ncbi:MAG: DHCW motif cupin fold protein [Candidatus Aminicenantes bacterium]|nr:MAG: DHCW motif cupin fold protein [Candidatus Aminicenantes bacterium]